MPDPLTSVEPMLSIANLETAVAEEIKLVVIVLGIITLVVTVTVSRTIRSAITSRDREQTKRELAAYIAEGSISPDDAKAILHVGEGDDIREFVLKRAADGWISAKKAQQIISTLESDKQGRPAKT
ncbi:MAG: hypothetical protein AAGB48_03760 [Planctomycetota bacterium]